MYLDAFISMSAIFFVDCFCIRFLDDSIECEIRAHHAQSRLNNIKPSRFISNIFNALSWHIFSNNISSAITTIIDPTLVGRIKQKSSLFRTNLPVIVGILFDQFLFYELYFVQVELFVNGIHF